MEDKFTFMNFIFNSQNKVLMDPFIHYFLEFYVPF